MNSLDLAETIDPRFWKSNRLASFENWPFQSDCTCTPEKMAAAGFVLIGKRETEPDLVECFICGKQLDDWDSDDDPWSEHQKHMPSCAYIGIGKRDEVEWTLAELFTLHKEFVKRSLKIKYEHAISELKAEAADLSDQISKSQKTVRKVRKGRPKRSGA